MGGGRAALVMDFLAISFAYPSVEITQILMNEYQRDGGLENPVIRGNPLGALCHYRFNYPDILAIVNLLAEQRIPLKYNEVNDFGLTPIDFAMRRGAPDAVQMMLRFLQLGAWQRYNRHYEPRGAQQIIVVKMYMSRLAMCLMLQCEARSGRKWLPLDLWKRVQCMLG